MANFINEERVDNLRERYLNAGMKDLKSRIREMDIQHNREVVSEERKVEPKYTKHQIAEKAIDTYLASITFMISSSQYLNNFWFLLAESWSICS